MDILKPNISFDVISAARAWPDGPPISNIDILQKFPRTANKSADFYKKMDEKIREDLGFCTRYWVHKPWESLDKAIATSESLAIAAVKKMLASRIPPSLQAFLLGSTTNKRYTGSQACAVLGEFGLSVPAYDLKAGCSTSLATLQLAYALMNLGYEQVVVSCSETLSKVIDPDNEKTWLGVADGAAAIWVKKNSTGKFTVEKSLFSTEGVYVDAYTTRGLLPPSHCQLDTFGYVLQGDEALLKELAVRKYTDMLDKLLPSKQDRMEISWIIPHQVNRSLIDYLIQQYQLEHSILLWDADRFGNIGGASILFTLARAIENNVFDKEGKLLMMSVGGGLSYAAQVISYKQK